jgi:hypothetical protein
MRTIKAARKACLELTERFKSANLGVLEAQPGTGMDTPKTFKNTKPYTYVIWRS